MSTAKTKQKPTERESILKAVVAREVAAFDRYVMKQAKEMSRPKEVVKTSKSPK